MIDRFRFDERNDRECFWILRDLLTGEELMRSYDSELFFFPLECRERALMLMHIQSSMPDRLEDSRLWC